MNEKALQVLEYHKIIQKLTEFAGCEPGKALCRELVPSAEISEIRRMQQETSDAAGRLLRKGNVSFSGVSDMRMSLTPENETLPLRRSRPAASEVSCCIRRISLISAEGTSSRHKAFPGSHPANSVSFCMIL